MATPADEFIADVINDILSRLPVKSLIRFQSVSKPFCAFISDPAFARRQGTLFLLLSRFKTKAFVISSGPRDDPEISDFSFPNKKSKSPIIGSGDGLLCFTRGRDIRVWNPTTRELNVLPDPDLLALLPSGVHARILEFCRDVYYTYVGTTPCFGGICYDPVVDDHKVVVFFGKNYVVFEGLKGNLGKHRRRGGFCWDLNSFHRDQGDRCSYHRGCRPYATEPVNGAIHWMVRTCGSNANRELSSDHGWEIYSFDLAKEEFGKVGHPADCYFYCAFELGVLNGCLCLVCTGKASAMFDIDQVWIMKEYGVVESWTKWTVEEGSMLICDKIYTFAADGRWWVSMLRMSE